MESVELEEKLIELVRGKAFLYDKSLKGYKDTLKRENAFQEIGEVLGITGAQASKKWADLRKQYTNYLLKLKKPTGSGGKSKSKYRHAQLMEFYRCHYHAYKSFSNIEDDTNAGETMEDVNGNLEVEFEGFGEDVPEVIVHPSRQDPGSSTFETPKSRIQKRKRSDVDDINAKLIAALEKTAPAEDDEFDHFGANISLRIRKLAKNSFVEAAKLQLKIQEIVTEFEIRAATSKQCLATESGSENEDAGFSS